MSVVVGVFAFARAFPNVWAVDAHRNLAAGSAALNGSFGTVSDYLYSPLAAVLTIPALFVPPDVAVAGWFVVKVALLVLGTASATRGLATTDRVLVGIALVFFLPILYDLELGNVTVFVLAAVALVAWRADRFITGIPLGLLLATAPKPQLIPVLLWMILANRKAMAGALFTATSATLVAIVAIGTPAYTTWIATLRAPAYINAGEVINLAIWPQPLIVVVVGSVAAVLAFGVALRRGYWPGLIAAMCLGLLLAPYTLIYGAALLPAAAPAAARAAPRPLLLLALAAPVALILVFPLWVGVVLGLAALLPAAAWPHDLRAGSQPLD
ncbi:MAG: glycosyltransferase family 87 protein [Acidimicrobiales bacterium]|nr:glycosyltransferase family 87 protein [Acidimicrobiales bacterium]